MSKTYHLIKIILIIGTFTSCMSIEKASALVGGRARSRRIFGKTSTHSDGNEFEVVFEGSQETSQHDSGGPLFLESTGGLVLIGIVRGIPYTSVFKNLDWIYSMVNRPIDSPKY